jgi:hypothetical protein
MASKATPSATNPKMTELYNQSAQSSAHQTCAENGCFKHPHTLIIDEYKWSNSGWFLLGCGAGGRLTSNLLG